MHCTLQCSSYQCLIFCDPAFGLALVTGDIQSIHAISFISLKSALLSGTEDTIKILTWDIGLLLHIECGQQSRSSVAYTTRFYYRCADMSIICVGLKLACVSLGAMCLAVLRAY